MDYISLESFQQGLWYKKDRRLKHWEYNIKDNSPNALSIKINFLRGIEVPTNP